MTLCSIHRPRAKRTKKHSERNTQSRNMPIQMESRRPWKPARHKKPSDKMSLIFDIKRYAINDGPGIRITLFQQAPRVFPSNIY